MKLSLVCALMAGMTLFSSIPAPHPIPQPTSADSVQKQAHATTFRMFVSGAPLIDEGFMCSATAIGPHALLTATHCDQGVKEFLLGEQVVKVFGSMQDGEDHTVFLLDTPFSTWSTMANHPLAQGDHVFMFGNPGILSDIYREGYVAGFAANTSDIIPDFHNHGKTLIMCDMNGYKGDSGAAIFNLHGQVAGVVSVFAVNSDEDDPAWTFKLQGSFPLSFSSKDQDMFTNWKPGQPVPGVK